MSKVLSVNNGNYTVKVEGGGQILFDTSRGTLVSGKPAGTVVIRGSLEVEGTTTTVESNDTLINDNILTLNNGQTGAGISASKNYQAGIEIDRGSEATAKFVFDDSVAWDIGGDSGTGGFKLFTGSGAKTTLVLDGIKSNAALYIDTGNNGISVTNATDYETNVFPYTGSAVTGGAIDDDMIPNAKAVVDYVAFANASLLQNRIEEGTTTKTFVQSRDKEVTGNPSEVSIGIDNETRALFFLDTIQLGDIVLQGSQISTINTNEDLRLEAAGTGSVQINDKLHLTSTAHASDAAIDPLKPTTGSILYTKTEDAGGTGLFFVNSSNTQNEIISNNRSLLYSMIF
tara:strand:+ start:510 stop:1538 length:1029 start_codon:yes stop_codon:yes gene_type:complete